MLYIKRFDDKHSIANAMRSGKLDFFQLDALSAKGSQGHLGEADDFLKRFVLLRHKKAILMWPLLVFVNRYPFLVDNVLCNLFW